jgi:hypothetical protein
MLYLCPYEWGFMCSIRQRGPGGEEGYQYETVACPACALVHLVNPTTGKVLGVLPPAGASESRRGQGARGDLTTVI